MQPKTVLLFDSATFIGNGQEETYSVMLLPKPHTHIAAVIAPFFIAPAIDPVPSQLRQYLQAPEPDFDRWVFGNLRLGD